MDHHSQPKSHRRAGDRRVCRLQYSEARRYVGYQEDLCHWTQSREHQHSMGTCILAKCTTICHWLHLVGGRLSRDCRGTVALHDSEYPARRMFAKCIPAKRRLPLFGCSERYRRLCSGADNQYLYHIRRYHPARNHQPHQRTTGCGQSSNPRFVIFENATRHRCCDVLMIRFGSLRNWLCH
jgi:hypothetical protein